MEALVSGFTKANSFKSDAMCSVRVFEKRLPRYHRLGKPTKYMVQYLGFWHRVVRNGSDLFIFDKRAVDNRVKLFMVKQCSPYSMGLALLKFN